jgi:predicted AlkP superfamily pyrophosphatase or phosphodiesterase
VSRSKLSLFLLLALCGAAGVLPALHAAEPPTGPAQASTEAAPIVILLSWDGMRHDYLDRAEFPALARVADQGVRAERLQPVFPSSTFPGHVSMATGTYPDRHGIVANVFIDRERGRYSYSSDANWIEAEPLWIAAERQGVPAATYFWVGSETDWHDQGVHYRIAPFDGSRPESVKVNQILQWLSLPESERPRLIMSYWAGADSVGHDQGPNAAELIVQIQAQDAELARLLDGLDRLGLWSRTTLVIVSDHGMAVASEALDAQAALADAGIGAQVLGGAVAQIYLDDPTQADAAGLVLTEYLSGVPAELFRPESLPDRYRLRRADRLGEWIAVVEPPYAFYRPSGLDGWLLAVAGFFGREFGVHGYDPRLPDMGGIFLAMGRGVPRGAALGVVRQIDVAATVAGLLGIDPPRDSEGTRIF